jgi:diguanylate cyclase (GGDEF)-like protein/PAS domain S-box-containing protein
MSKRHTEGFSDLKNNRNHRSSSERYSDLVEHLPIGVYRTTPNGKIVEANQALIKILGYQDEEDLKKVNAKDLYVRKEDRKEHLEKLDFEPTCFAEFELKRKDGETIWGRDYCRAIKKEDGEIEYYDGILVEITLQKRTERELKRVLNELEKSNNERKNMIDKLKELSLTDDLTGLLNRRGFFTIAGEHLKLAERRNSMMFLLFMDLDNLKIINDTLGHHKGDQALIELARIIRETFRKSDVKGRMGGDEFAVFPIDESRRGLDAVLKRLNGNIDKFNANKNNPFEISISMGVSCFDPDYPCSIDELLVRADKLMYEQKKDKERSEAASIAS